MTGEIIPFTLTPTARAARIYVGQMQRAAAIKRMLAQQRGAANTTEKK